MRNLQLTTYNFQPSTFNLQPSTHNFHHLFANIKFVINFVMINSAHYNTYEGRKYKQVSNLFINDFCIHAKFVQ